MCQLNLRIALYAQQAHALHAADGAHLVAQRVLRAHGAVRVLALREKLPGGMRAERCAIEDIMLLLTKGEEPGHARNTL